MDENENVQDPGASLVKIKVVGVGGGGNNAVNRMIEAGIQAVDFVAVNTDKQALLTSNAPTRLQIGERLTSGWGAGGKPEIGQKAAEESKSSITEMLQGTNLLFITAGLGGGPGSGAAPIIAQIAKELGILTVAVVTKPFDYEGPIRAKNAENALEALTKQVDGIVVIPNQKLLTILPKKTGFKESLRYADEVLRQGVQGIYDIITTTGLINLDFADLTSIMKGKGQAHMGIGYGTGENRALDAVKQAVASPLLETTIEGATGILLNIKGGNDLTQEDVSEANTLIREIVGDDCNIITGTSFDDNMRDEIEITLIATGFKKPEERKENTAATAAKSVGTMGQPSHGPEQMQIFGFRPGQRPEDRPQPAPVPPIQPQTPNANSNSGDGSNVPPWIEKLRRNKK